MRINDAFLLSILSEKGSIEVEFSPLKIRGVMGSYDKVGKH